MWCHLFPNRPKSPKKRFAAPAWDSHWETNWKKRMACRHYKYSSLLRVFTVKGDSVCAIRAGSAHCWAPSVTRVRVQSTASNGHHTRGRVRLIKDLLIISHEEPLRGRTSPLPADLTTSAAPPLHKFHQIKSIFNSFHLKKVCQSGFFIGLRWSPQPKVFIGKTVIQDTYLSR